MQVYSRKRVASPRHGASAFRAVRSWGPRYMTSPMPKPAEHVGSFERGT